MLFIVLQSDTRSIRLRAASGDRVYNDVTQFVSPAYNKGVANPVCTKPEDRIQACFCD